MFKSLRWPGAITVQQYDKWVQIYVGHGIKGGTETYYPVNPPCIHQEPEDPQEQYEPNPKDPPAEASGDESKEVSDSD